MELRFSVMARDRRFSKALRGVRLKLQPLLDAFGRAELQHPIHKAILVGITDDKEPESLEEIENNDGFFQVVAGCLASRSESDLAEAVFSILLRAVRLCPFAKPDHEMFEELFAEMRPVVLS
jgi:hypothetical protein